MLRSHSELQCYFKKLKDVDGHFNRCTPKPFRSAPPFCTILISALDNTLSESHMSHTSEQISDHEPVSRLRQQRMEMVTDYYSGCGRKRFLDDRLGEKQ